MKDAYHVRTDGFEARWFEGTAHREKAVIWMHGSGMNEKHCLEDSLYLREAGYPHPEKALGEMARILKPGGALLLNDMDCAAPIRAFANWIFPKLPGGDVKMYNRAEIEDMMSSAGFRRIRYRKISPFSFQCVGEKEA